MHAAKGLFEEHGIDNVTFQMIADKSEMCRTTIFNHFSGIEDLMLALSSQEIMDIKDYCEENALEGRDLVYGLYDKLIEDTALYPALTSTLTNNAILSKDQNNPVRILINLTLKGIQDMGYEDSELRAMMTEGAYYGLVNHYHVTGKKFDAEIMKKEFRLMTANFIGGEDRW